MLEQIVNKGFYSERDAAVLVRQITETVDYLHSQGIVHRDLNPGNILLAGDADSVEHCQIKIADFGLASFFEHEAQQMFTCCGTPEYVAPEVLEGKGYGYQCDVWSIGIILYIMLCGYPPFYDESIAGQFKLICQGNIEFPDPEWTNISVEAKDLVSHMLVVKPELRFGSRECLAHPWLNQRTWGGTQVTAAGQASQSPYPGSRGSSSGSSSGTGSGSRLGAAERAHAPGTPYSADIDQQQAAWASQVKKNMSTFLENRRDPPPLSGARPRPRRRIAGGGGGPEGAAMEQQPRGSMASLTRTGSGGDGRKSPGGVRGFGRIAGGGQDGPYRVPEPEPQYSRAAAPAPHYGGANGIGGIGAGPYGGSGGLPPAAARVRRGVRPPQPADGSGAYPTLARQPHAAAQAGRRSGSGSGSGPARFSPAPGGNILDEPPSGRPFGRRAAPVAAARDDGGAQGGGGAARHTPGAGMFRQHPATQLPPPPAEGSRRPVPRHRHGTPGGQPPRN